MVCCTWFRCFLTICLFSWISKYMSTPQIYVFISNYIEVQNKKDIKNFHYGWTVSIRINSFSWCIFLYYLFGKLARHFLNSLYVKEHEYFILCSFQTTYASLHIVKSNTYRVPIKSTLRHKLCVILNFLAKLFHIFS